MHRFAFNLPTTLSGFDVDEFGNFSMNRFKRLLAGLLLPAACGVAFGQGPRPYELGASDLDIGEAGIAWYTTWDTAWEEAQRSGRPIMFVAAATQCHGVSGVF